MKAPGEPISIPVHSSERPSDDKISVQIENATTGSHSDSNGIAESDDVGVSFGNATAWMTGQNDVSVPVSVDTRAKSHGDTELGYNSASSIIVDEPVDCAISFGAFDQPAVSADSAAPQESKPSMYSKTVAFSLVLSISMLFRAFQGCHRGEASGCRVAFQNWRETEALKR